MPGINDSTLVHGVIDLINKNLRGRGDSDPWGGTPSVVLYREHPDDDWVVTSARLMYPSGYSVFIRLNRGMTDEEIEQSLLKNKSSTDISDLPPVFENSDPSDESLDDFNLKPVEEQNPDFGPRIIEYGSHGSYMLEPTLPLEVVDRDHYDFEFYQKWRLRNVKIEKYSDGGELIDGIYYHMVYDLESRLTAALVERI